MKRYIRMLSFSTVFVVGGILHVLLRQVAFTDCFSQLFYGVMVLIWGRYKISSLVGDIIMMSPIFLLI